MPLLPYEIWIAIGAVACAVMALVYTTFVHLFPR